MFKVPKNPTSFSLAYKGEFNPFNDDTRGNSEIKAEERAGRK